ncbi:MAG: ABC transporter permease [Thermoproteota archaeon]|nr:MAG: ABC transporter permease [Candidatus Korarchaeota archaeon]
MWADVRASWAIAKKDLKCYYARPGAILFGIMFPFFMFLSFAVGRDLPLERALPGLTSMVIMFSASSIGPFSIPLERRLKTFDRLLAAPISFYSILAGKMAAGALYGLAVGSIPLAVGALLGAGTEDPALLAVFLPLSSACFAAMGVMFASIPTEYPGNVNIALNFVRLPMIFVSGIFTPLAEASLEFRLISTLSPLTYANDAVRTAFGLPGAFNLLADAAGLIFFSLAFLAVGAKLHEKFIELSESPRGQRMRQRAVTAPQEATGIARPGRGLPSLRRERVASTPAFRARIGAAARGSPRDLREVDEARE